MRGAVSGRGATSPGACGVVATGGRFPAGAAPGGDGVGGDCPPGRSGVGVEFGVSVAGLFPGIGVFALGGGAGCVPLGWYEEDESGSGAVGVVWAFAAGDAGSDGAGRSVAVTDADDVVLGSGEAADVSVVFAVCREGFGAAGSSAGACCSRAAGWAAAISVCGVGRMGAGVVSAGSGVVEVVVVSGGAGVSPSGCACSPPLPVTPPAPSHTLLRSTG